MSYRDYINSLKTAVGSASTKEFPRLIALTGPSQFLHLKASQILKLTWDKFEESSSQAIEASELDQTQFIQLVTQTSLFEPDTLYVIRRASSIKNLGTWLASIKSHGNLKSHIILDGAEKLSADLVKQIQRLQGTVIHCEEPGQELEFLAVTQALGKRLGIVLEEPALKYLLDSTGLDLGRVENELNKLSLQFCDAKRPLTMQEVSQSMGCMREDDVFELFGLLRGKRTSQTHLKTETFINRGESAIAMTGIFSRFAREQIERNAAKRGILGIKQCALADRVLKSSRTDESLVLSGIIDAMAEV